MTWMVEEAIEKKAHIMRAWNLQADDVTNTI